MQPSLQTDDLVVAYEMPSYRIGDVIVYDKFGGSIVHEIVGAPNIGVFRTEGIHNNHLDSWNVRTSDIRGKVLFVIPKLGGFFVLLGTNPLFAGAAGVLVAVGVLLPSRKPKYSERLKHLLIHSAQEQRRIKPSAALAITLLWVLVIASIAATVLQLIQGLPLFPRVSWSLVAMITAFAILIGFWEFNGDGRGQPEPKKSMAILGPRLHRVPPEVEIAGVNDTVIRMKSASQLRNVKEHGNLPVFHQIDVATRTHKFWIITDAAVYTWQVQSQLKEPLADARLNSANEI